MLEWGYAVVFGKVRFESASALADWKTASIETTDLDDFGGLYFDVHEKIGKTIAEVISAITQRGAIVFEDEAVLLRISDDKGTEDKFAAFACLVVGAIAAAARFHGTGELWLLAPTDGEEHVRVEVAPDRPVGPGDATIEGAKGSPAFKAVREAIGFGEHDLIVLEAFDDDW